ncbi:hypothetical protein WN944_022451 [Citrus x changshan-huyou]|uniref:Uncharacterized protein n=1 Tax=Citrus x changshan-huyou TaxID=2935761 RepID=A0AAP0N4J7_9ROSI
MGIILQEGWRRCGDSVQVLSRSASEFLGIACEVEKEKENFLVRAGQVISSFTMLQVLKMFGCGRSSSDHEPH